MPHNSLLAKKNVMKPAHKKIENDKGKKKVDLRKDLRNQWYLTQQIIYTKLK